MSQPAPFLPDAAEQFDSVADFAFEDLEPRRLRYHLLRLTVTGLARDEVDPLCAVGRLAFAEEDVGPAADRVRQRDGATPLAVVLADLAAGAESGSRGRASTRSVLLGAVLGAYAGVHDVEGLDRTRTAILGAIGGAVAAATVDGALANAEQVGPEPYTEPLPD